MLRTATYRRPTESPAGFEAKEKKPRRTNTIPFVGFVALLIGITALGSILAPGRIGKEFNPNAAAKAPFSSFKHGGIRIPGATASPRPGSSSGGGDETVSGALSRYKKFAIVVSPKPVPKPSIPPTYYHTRGCTCKENWQEIIAKYPTPIDLPPGGKHWTQEEAEAAAKIPGESVCTCGGVECLPQVTPAFLTEAIGQDVCSLRRHTGYGCSAACSKDGEVWTGGGVGGGGRRATTPPLPFHCASPPPLCRCTGAGSPA
jgi:hypothetical protein